SFGSQPRHIRSLARFTELEEVIDFVVAGVGLSVVPRDSASAAIARGDVEVLYAAPGRACWNTVYFVTRAGATVRPRLHRLIELIQAAATRGAALRSWRRCCARSTVGMRRFDASPGQGRMPPATSARFVGFPDTAELPIYLTPLLGREADVARVCSLFREARLV